ncbi:MAG: zinc metallopeptidase [Bacteroidia bacterium]
MYWILIIGVMGLSWFVQSRLRSKFKKYSRTPLTNNMSGREVAERMLADHGITDVKVISVNGQLTDHYNPVKKTVNLSEAVYHHRNAAAAAVAAHECGHAVQHARAYSWLEIRSKLVPVVSVSSRWMQWVILAGIFLMGVVGPTLLYVGIGLFAFTTIFSFITLPVEFDASRRALAWMEDRNIVNSEELVLSKDALKWAALTYVVAAIGSLATLLYYIALARD